MTAVTTPTSWNRVRQLLGSAANLWRPPPKLSPSQWSEQHFRLAVEESATPGRYRLDRHEFLREIMDCFGDPTIAEVVCIKAGQVGWTTMLSAMVGYAAAHDPSRLLFILPTESEGEIWSKDRFEPNIRATPELKRLFRPAKSRDANNKILHKRFPGGALKIRGANSPTGLASYPAPRIFADEVDRYPASAGDEGDPLALLRKRNQTWGARRKMMIGSTPDISGASAIMHEYQGSDRREYLLCCPSCGDWFVPGFFRSDMPRDEQALPMGWVDWDKAENGIHQPETARLVCPHCKAGMFDDDRLEMVSGGKWQATAELTNRAGFWVRGTLAPDVSLGEMADRWLRAKTDEHRKAFINLDLGEPFRMSGEQLDPEDVFRRRENFTYGRVPMGGLVLTAGADVQRDRIEVYVWAWGAEERGWLIDKRYLIGKPNGPEVWQELDRVLAETWPHEGGVEIGLSRLAIDTGDGLFTAEVYRWCHKHGHQKVTPVKGASRQEKIDASVPVKMSEPVNVVTSTGRKIRNGLRVALIATGVLKSELLQRLRMSLSDDGSSPPGWLALPRSADLDVCQQLTAEELVFVPSRKGPGEYQWRKRQGRNEALDCYVYARAAAILCGLPRWTAHRWRDRQAALGLLAEDREEAARMVESDRPEDIAAVAADLHGQRRQMRGRAARRVVRSSWMN